MDDPKRFVRNPKPNRFMAYSDEQFEAVDATHLHGLAKGEWYEEVMERYLQRMDRIPSKKDGSIHYAAIERDTGVTYQSIMKNIFLKQGIIDAAEAKGTREQPEATDGVVDRLDNPAKDKEIKALKERMKAMQGEIGSLQDTISEQHDKQLKLEAHIQELMEVIQELEARLDEVDIVPLDLRHATHFIDNELLNSGTLLR